MTKNSNHSWRSTIVMLCLTMVSPGFCGDEDTVRYMDILSGSGQLELGTEELSGSVEISRYWASEEHSFENHFLGTGLGIEITNDTWMPHVLAKYSYMGMMGCEIGPKIGLDDAGGMIRTWAGLFIIGAQTSYSYTLKSKHQVDFGIYLSFPLGEHRNGKYAILPAFL